MLKTAAGICLALGATCALALPAAAQTVRVVVAQADADKNSFRRGTEIQSSVLNAFNSALNSPTASDVARRYGFDGFDVYDEVFLTRKYGKQNRTRRSHQELLEVLTSIRKPRLDLAVFYTLYVRAVESREKTFTQLQMSMRYRVMDIRNGRQLGGETLDIDTDGVRVTGCAARGVPHCVRRYIASNAEELVREAATTIALKIAAMTNNVKGTQATQPISTKDAAPVAGGTRSKVCAARPTEYIVTFTGMARRDVRRIVERMDDWPCRIDLSLERSRSTDVSYAYKFRASVAHLHRNIEMTMEELKVIGHVNLKGSNELVVKAVGIRKN